MTSWICQGCTVQEGKSEKLSAQDTGIIILLLRNQIQLFNLFFPLCSYAAFAFLLPHVKAEHVRPCLKTLSIKFRLISTLNTELAMFFSATGERWQATDLATTSCCFFVRCFFLFSFVSCFPWRCGRKAANAKGTTTSWWPKMKGPCSYCAICINFLGFTGGAHPFGCSQDRKRQKQIQYSSYML